MDKIKSLAIILCALSLNLVTSEAYGAEKVRLGTPVKLSPQYAIPLLAAEDMSSWKTEGLEVEWIPFEGGPAMYRAVAAGSLDMGMTGPLSLIPAAAAGVPIIIVADTQLKQPYFVWVRSDSRIREAKDLKGAKLGIQRLGSVPHAYGLVLAKALGMEKDIRFVGGGGVTEELAAIKMGTLDGRITDFLTMAPLKIQGEVREVLSLQDYLPREWVDQVIFAGKEMVKNKPDLVRRVVRVLFYSMDFLMKNPQWSLERMKSFSGYSDEAAKAILKLLRYGKDGRINRRGLENVRSFLIDYGIVAKEKVPPVEDLYTEEFTR